MIYDTYDIQQCLQSRMLSSICISNDPEFMNGNDSISYSLSPNNAYNNTFIANVNYKHKYLKILNNIIFYKNQNFMNECKLWRK